MNLFYQAPTIGKYFDKVGFLTLVFVKFVADWYGILLLAAYPKRVAGPTQAFTCVECLFKTFAELWGLHETRSTVVYIIYIYIYIYIYIRGASDKFPDFFRMGI